MKKTKNPRILKKFKKSPKPRDGEEESAQFSTLKSEIVSKLDTMSDVYQDALKEDKSTTGKAELDATSLVVLSDIRLVTCVLMVETLNSEELPDANGSSQETHISIPTFQLVE